MSKLDEIIKCEKAGLLEQELEDMYLELTNLETKLWDLEGEIADKQAELRKIKE